MVLNGAGQVFGLGCSFLAREMWARLRQELLPVVGVVSSKKGKSDQEGESEKSWTENALGSFLPYSAIQARQDLLRCHYLGIEKERLRGHVTLK